MKRYLEILAHLGTDPKKSRLEQREVVLCNKVILLLIPLTAFAIGFSYTRDSFSFFVSSTIFFFLLFVFLGMNRYGNERLARILLSLIPPIFLLVPFWVGDLSLDESYHSFSYILVGLVFIPMLLFYRRSDRKYLVSILVFHFIVLIYFDIQLNKIGADLYLYIIPQLIFWTLMVGIFQFLKRESLLIEDNLKESNESLKLSNEEIRASKEEIQSQNEFLSAKQEKIEEQAEAIAQRNHELNATKIELLKMIDQLKEARIRLLEKEAETKSILNALTEHYLVAQFDMEGRLVSINRKIAELIGEFSIDKLNVLKSRESANSNIPEREKSQDVKRIWLNILKGRSVTMDIEMPVMERPMFFSTTLAPLMDPAGKPHRVLAIGQDITELMDKQDKIDKINEELKEKLFEISQQNQLLNFQQREIFDKSEELKIQSEEIQAINESLEERVRERTRVLEEKNKQLAEYAFINSHVLRAPVSTMMGLINLISYSSLPLEDQRIYKHLIETTKVLDSIVYRINDAIENGSQLDRNLIEPEREFLPMK